MAPATYKSTPTGGVIYPMARLITIRTPKKTGSMPYCNAAGKNIGASIDTVAAPVISVPAARIPYLVSLKTLIYYQ